MDVLVIGAGPAGLMAAEVLASRGRQVTIFDSKPSFGRKFLMAGKSGLNITKEESFNDFMANFKDDREKLEPILQTFGPEKIKDWVLGLGQEIFVGSTGRVFPKSMKASPLLRAWLQRLNEFGVKFETNHKFIDWKDHFVFDTGKGIKSFKPKTVILALGGSSWAKLGSDGKWDKILKSKDIDLNQFKPANVGVQIKWSKFMNKYFGEPLKNIKISSGKLTSRGEALITKSGLEGGGVYEVSTALREGGYFEIDLFPDFGVKYISNLLSKPRQKNSIGNHLRKTLNLSGARMALVNEALHPIQSDLNKLAHSLKNLKVNYLAAQPIDQAISTSGGVAFSALDNKLMLRKAPQVFCVGEMIDWDAPTGGYLLTACISTGYWVGLNA
ncbi:MAG: TIGR03862 family flavoprotein [Paracoccaceae bacterium]|nr:TIGR03862 family flavoprotein [Paracoccaceae bacterium]